MKLEDSQPSCIFENPFSAEINDAPGKLKL
jgi:hypothetical protein